ncbi:MAG: alpha/beta hydrolase [Lachnospiraceae bacterium]|nr:alpha/beta hydrolase [Lachnospiraceae bacterium]
MNDFLRESFSYSKIFKEIRKIERKIDPEKLAYGPDKNQYYFYYEPDELRSDKIIVWIHGGGWNAGTPEDFDYMGQRIAGEGYRFISIGYRLSTQKKYPAQIEDVSAGYNHAVSNLKEKGIDNPKIIICGPSAGAHLSSILTFSKADQERYGVDISGVVGYVGWGGPYCFNEKTSFVLRLLENQLFPKGYDRKQAEPVSLLTDNNIPMLLIQSRHDGIVDFSFAEDFRDRACELGMQCELYEVTDELNTHSWYTAGVFVKNRSENKSVDKFYTWVEER